VVFLIVAAIFASHTSAQESLPERQHFILNLFVDATYGSDPGAMKALTPSQGVWRVVPLQKHPNSSGPSGILTSIPYTFQTINGPNGCLAWLKNVLSATGAGAPGAFVNSAQPNRLPWLPWQNNQTGKILDYVVIHVLPGLYGPRATGFSNLDPKSGLIYNGDKLPIALPPRVCIQGTSALDVIFDARCKETFPAVSIFTFDTSYSCYEKFKRTFIDSVTIRGARGEVGTHGITGVINFPGAGVLIADDNGQILKPIISNCFIVDNTVGIGIGSAEGTVNCPVIVNNTIAWNEVGLWNGGNPLSSSSQVAPTCKPTLINNIFDSTSPTNRNTYSGYAGLVAGRSGFEGVSSGELTVSQVAGNNVNVDYNAYEYPNYNNRRVNLGVAPQGWPSITVLPALNPGPNVDISVYTGNGATANRGSLYINDIFYNARSLLPGGHDLSFHDFRMTYHVGTNPSGLASGINPLKDAGLNLVSSNIPIQMGNNNTLNEVPGIPSGVMANAPTSYADYATYFCSDEDCEGFGNPRIFPTGGTVDIGADEVGNLIIAGYINGTRIFSKNPSERDPSKATNAMDNTHIYFFNQVTNPPTSYPRPEYNEHLSISYRWSGLNPPLPGNPGDVMIAWDWWVFQWGPNGSIANYGCQEDTSQYINNYTKGLVLIDGNQVKHYSIRANLTGVPAFPRNLVCDFSPALIMDPHPYWSWSIEPYGYQTSFQDSFGSNVWCSNQGTYVWDNKYVYYVRNSKDVTSGVINPPGSWQLVSGNLDPWAPRAQFGPLSGGGNSYSVNNWGFGDNQGVDIVPDTTLMTPLGPAVGWRVNCQLPGSSNGPGGNFQTFIGVNWVSPTGSKRSYYTYTNLSGEYKNRKSEVVNPLKVLEILRAKK